MSPKLYEIEYEKKLLNLSGIVNGKGLLGMITELRLLATILTFCEKVASEYVHWLS
jgi:hypothetical protein